MADYDAKLIDAPDLLIGNACGGTINAQLVNIAGVADSTTPVLANFTPSAGATLAKYDPVTFDVTDVLVDNQFRVTVAIYVYIVAHDVDELAYIGSGENSGWTNRYRSTIPGEQASSLVAIADGYRFTLRRKQGWPTGGVSVKVLAVDRGGNIGVL